VPEFDVVIRGGTVVDGTGAPARAADIAIVGDRIVAVGEPRGDAARTIDATDRIVTPGFFDPHTHLDAQIGWDPTGSPVCWHGVTSIVLGNCGVTFAPCPPGGATRLAQMMEAVEDIPADAILSGLPWDWDGYDGYLATLGRLPKALNVGGMVGHCAVRSYVLGDESLDPERQPRAAELAQMQGLVDDALAAGALGLSTSRTLSHQLPDGRQVPGTFAGRDELFALCEPLRRRGVGLFESAARFGEYEDEDERRLQTRAEVALHGDISRWTGRPATFNLFNHELGPDVYRVVLEAVAHEVEHGALLRPQVAARRITVLRSLAHNLPFAGPEWERLGTLDLAARLAAIEDEVVLARLIDQAGTNAATVDPGRTYMLGSERADYEFGPDDSLMAHAGRTGRSPAAVFLEHARTSRGRGVWVTNPLNHLVDGIERMITDPNTVLGLGDTGAHVGYITDASLPTYVLSHWTRDVGLFSLEEGVRRLTTDPARLFGQHDRSVLREGAFADINVIDLQQLGLPVPEYRWDLPGGAGRWVQLAHGYDLTLVNGTVVVAAGDHTEAIPGVVLGAGT